ncbi:hypothetical protein CQ015_09590 [Arthrobacter sp. MYb221]|nr:hypothetical protein CQ015_09590 [Arthrobacter sp. MYb221]
MLANPGLRALSFVLQLFSGRTCAGDDARGSEDGLPADPEGIEFGRSHGNKQCIEFLGRWAQ